MADIKIKDLIQNKKEKALVKLRSFYFHIYYLELHLIQLKFITDLQN